MLALHACGAASDWALLQAARCGAAFIVSPCCIGKVSHGHVPAEQQQQQEQQQQGQERVEALGGLRYPRSAWLAGAIAGLAPQLWPQMATVLESKLQVREGEGVGGPELYALLASAADYSHAEGHGYPALAAAAKATVEADRGLAAAETGAWVTLVRLLAPQLTAKSDVLVGVPCDTNMFAWPWASRLAAPG